MFAWAATYDSSPFLYLFWDRHQYTADKYMNNCIYSKILLFQVCQKPPVHSARETHWGNSVFYAPELIVFQSTVLQVGADLWVPGIQTPVVSTCPNNVKNYPNLQVLL